MDTDAYFLYQRNALSLEVFPDIRVWFDQSVAACLKVTLRDEEEEKGEQKEEGA